VLASTARVAGDLDLAEECVQEAYAAALRAWVTGGIPDNPAAWLTTAARRRAIDVIRRERALRARLPLLVEPEGGPGQDEDAMDPPAPALGDGDDRLRLPAVKADLLARLGRTDEAAGAYRRALELTANEAERAFLAERLAALGRNGARPE
jgi:predicted RNA polymerase sigma factor